MNRFPFTPHPNSWFVIAFSDELPRGAVLVRHYFGRDIVLFRTEGGVAHAIDPYCPHLGAHLGHGGRVVGETLRCPFHGWCFDGTGNCVSVPEAPRPLRVSISAWHLREANGLLYVYHHADGAAPDWEVPEIDEEEWTPNQTVLWNLHTHPQEILENAVDITHLGQLHGMRNPRIVREPSEHGPALHVRLGYESPGNQPGMETEVELEVTMHGLGFVVVVAHVVSTGFRARQRLYPTPIDGERIDLRAVVNVERMADPEMTKQMADGFFQSFVAALMEDFPIWENKRYVERPPMTRPEHRSFSVFRKWVQRFYSS